MQDLTEIIYAAGWAGVPVIALATIAIAVLGIRNGAAVEAAYERVDLDDLLATPEKSED